jgi:stage III sporulation protein AE
MLSLIFLWLLSGPALAQDITEEAQRSFGTQELEEALPEEARELLEGQTAGDSDLSGGLRSIFSGTLDSSGTAVKRALSLSCRILAVVLLSSVLSGLGADSGGAMELAGVLAIGLVCVGQASGFFSLAAETIDAMTAFSSFLFTSLAAATAATGSVGTAGALYGVTVAVCGSLSRLLELIFLPATSCYMALMIANYALGDDSLRAVGDTIRGLSTSLLKLMILAFTAYLSLTRVIQGSADSAAVKAAKLAISSAVPVVGSMIADASETLLVSAGLLRSGIGVFGLLGVLAISIGPFLETGISYLMLKLTAAAAAVTGEKRLSGLISAMAGAIGLITAVTGVCTLLMMIGCVCFMKGAM